MCNWTAQLAADSYIYSVEIPDISGTFRPKIREALRSVRNSLVARSVHDLDTARQVSSGTASNDAALRSRNCLSCRRTNILLPISFLQLPFDFNVLPKYWNEFTCPTVPFQGFAFILPNVHHFTYFNIYCHYELFPSYNNLYDKCYKLH